MIGNSMPWGSKGFTILEEGELDRSSYQLVIHHYLVCRPDGEQLEGQWTLEQAKSEIERQEAAMG